MTTADIAALRAITKGGILRAAINTGNRALVQVEGDRLSGVSPALAERLAKALGAHLEPIVYDGAGKVFNDAATDTWDVGFLAIDATRAQKISFTQPYHVIEATYAVRAEAPFNDVDAADRPGVSVLTSTGSAYDMHLTATLRHARLERSGTPTESFAEFRDGRGDLVAGVRASLERYFAGDPGFRVLTGVLTRVEQAMVLPGAGNPLIGALDAFLATAVDEGFVARHLI